MVDVKGNVLGTTEWVAACLTNTLNDEYGAIVGFGIGTQVVHLDLGQLITCLDWTIDPDVGELLCAENLEWC